MPWLRPRRVRAALTGYVARLQLARRRTPISKEWGFDRGQPIDRHYIDLFLTRFSARPGYAIGSIHGRVLEIGGRDYVDRFGIAGEHPGPGVVHQVDVLHENPANPDSTIVGDLEQLGTLPEDAFDCILCTQVLCVVWDVQAAVRQLHRALRPGGVLLLTVPGITKAVTPDRDNWGDWWRFTSSSARRLVQEAFPHGTVEVEAYGNLQAATFFLHGFAAHELSPAELELRDPEYEILIGVRATKNPGSEQTRALPM